MSECAQGDNYNY